MSMLLTGLRPEVRQHLSVEFRSTGSAVIDVTPYEVPLAREIDAEPLRRIVDAARARFDDPVRSDAWLAPRIHATLRLTRREAADPGLWRGVGISVLPDYARWRFPDRENGTPAERFIGGENKNAVGRLWWGAEFLRTGSSYEFVGSGLEIQDIPNSFNFDFFHNRPMAIAAVQLLAKFRNGKPASGREANQLLKAANYMLTTTSLDSLVPDPGPDRTAVMDWVRQPVDETLLMDNDPVGPNEESVPDDAIQHATEFLRHVADTVGMRAVDPDDNSQAAAVA